MPGTSKINVRRIALLALTCLFAFGSFNAKAEKDAVRTKAIVKGYKTICVNLADQPSTLTERIKSILIDRIKTRCDVKLASSEKSKLILTLSVRPGIGTEGFRISDGPQGGIEITGNDNRGLLYGVGKFLRGSQYGPKGFTPSSWRGVSVPEKLMRGIYFATHFGNWYDLAPIDDIRYYVEDLALWGTNSLLVWFDMSIFKGIDDPKAQANLVRLRALLKTAKDLGLGVTLGTVANEGYANSPAALRADTTIGHDGYFFAPPSFPTDLCPNKPGSRELIIKAVEDRLTAFKSVGSDYYFIWPWDNGGCTCSKCAPWGANGYLMIAESIAKVYRQHYPNGKIILGTWCFDRFVKGEWEGMAKKFNAKRPDWVDYLIIGHGYGVFPEYPIKNGSPGGLPMLEFPEITMTRHLPWGGYGTNPIPGTLQELWDRMKDKLAGGIPYSEGKYDDINKAICAGFYWNENNKASDTVREYIAYYYSPDVVEPVSRAIAVLEQNLDRDRKDKDGVTQILMKNTKGAAETFALIEQADKKLTPQVRASWRWRILYLRALIDAELASHQLHVSQRCNKAFQELGKIYHNSPKTGEAVGIPKKILGIMPDKQ